MSIREKYDALYWVLRNMQESIKVNFRIMLNNRDWKDYLKQNKKFKNIHKGERCFVIGNGPSIKELDFSLLKDEYVFTVNQIPRNKNYLELCSNYHFWADDNFFNLDLSKPEDYEVLEVMRNVVTSNNKPICFYPIKYIEFIKENELDKITETHYFLSEKSFHCLYDKSIDYSKNTPGFGTVVQWCISMAIYMGFAQIYLLGCDSTSLINNIKAAADKIDDKNYGYQITENESKRYSKLMSNFTLSKSVDSFLKTLKDYKYLYEYCSKRNIELINLTSTTAIDSLPRNTLENILNGKK